MAMGEHHTHRPDATSGRTILLATITSLVVGGPLLGMMCFTLIATTTLLLLSAPLLLLFSPVLVPAALVLAGAMTVFGVAVFIGFVGLSTLMWAVRGVGWMLRAVSGERGKQGGMNFGRYLQQKGGAYEPRNLMSRGAAAS